jgi:hypothetical protein
MHNVQKKIGIGAVTNANDGLENVVEKYRLLHQMPFYIDEDEHRRVLFIPLISKETAAV